MERYHCHCHPLSVIPPAAGRDERPSQPRVPGVLSTQYCERAWSPGHLLSLLTIPTSDGLPLGPLGPLEPSLAGSYLWAPAADLRPFMRGTRFSLHNPADIANPVRISDPGSDLVRLASTPDLIHPPTHASPSSRASPDQACRRNCSVHPVHAPSLLLIRGAFAAAPRLTYSPARPRTTCRSTCSYLAY